MKCAQCRPLLSKYADGEALPAEQAQVESHLGGCPACSAMLVQYQVLRTRVGDLPHYRPDSRLRNRIFTAIDAHDAPAEIPITRRIAPAAPRSVQPAPSLGGRLFGNLATAFALVFLIGAGVLVWQMNTPGPNQYLRTPLATTESKVSNITVPTSVPSIGVAGFPKPQLTQVAAVAPGGTGAKTFAPSPTATFWGPVEDGSAMHSVRDETYGYQFQYPAGWWTAASAPVAGLLARRILRSWDATAAGAATLTMDVLANPGGQATRDTLAPWVEPNAQITALATAIAGLGGFSTVSESRGARRRATYLFAGTLVYRLTEQTGTGTGSAAAAAVADGTASNVAMRVLQSFVPAPDAATRQTGYRPLLCVHNGDLWLMDTENGASQQLTRSGGVRDFALSPDLSQVAILSADSSDNPWSGRLDLLSLADGTLHGLWITNEIHAVAWYSDHELVVLGGTQTPRATTPFGLYRLVAQTGGARTPLWDLSNLQDHGATASDLRVAPDRLTISFLAGGAGGHRDLYGVHPDGKYGRSLLPNISARPVVTAYAWLPPGETGTADRLVLLGNGQVQLLTLAGTPEPQLVPLTHQANTDFSDLAVAPDGEIALLAHAGGKPLQVYLHPDPATARAETMLPLAGVPLNGTLGWTANDRYVFYRQDTGGGAERVIMVNTAGGAAQPLGNLPAAAAP